MTSSTATQTANSADAAELIDVREVARLLGVSAKHARRLADRGAMPAPLRLSRLVRWRRDQVLDWIRSGCPSCRARRT